MYLNPRNYLSFYVNACPLSGSCWSFASGRISHQTVHLETDEISPTCHQSKYCIPLLLRSIIADNGDKQTIEFLQIPKTSLEE